MTGQFIFDEVLAYILRSDMRIQLDIDCNFKQILRSCNIHDCRSFAKAIENRHYNRWNIVDNSQWIIFKLDRYHGYIRAHNTDAFYNSWEQAFQHHVQQHMLEKEEFNVFSHEIIYIDSSQHRKREFEVEVEPKIIYTDSSRVVTQEIIEREEFKRQEVKRIQREHIERERFKCLEKERQEEVE